VPNNYDAIDMYTVNDMGRGDEVTCLQLRITSVPQLFVAVLNCRRARRLLRRRRCGRSSRRLARRPSPDVSTNTSATAIYSEAHLVNACLPLFVSVGGAPLAFRSRFGNFLGGEEEGERINHQKVRSLF
jgi:hypothetical protein